MSFPSAIQSALWIIVLASNMAPVSSHAADLKTQEPCDLAGFNLSVENCKVTAEAPPASAADISIRAEIRPLRNSKYQCEAINALSSRKAKIRLSEISAASLEQATEFARVYRALTSNEAERAVGLATISFRQMDCANPTNALFLVGGAQSATMNAVRLDCTFKKIHLLIEIQDACSGSLQMAVLAGITSFAELQYKRVSFMLVQDIPLTANDFEVEWSQKRDRSSDLKQDIVHAEFD